MAILGRSQRDTFLNAANRYVGANDAFDTFLLGTLSRRIGTKTKSDGDVTISHCICIRLGPHPGVLERISDFVGINKSKSKVACMREFRDALLQVGPNDLGELKRSLKDQTEVM